MFYVVSLYLLCDDEKKKHMNIKKAFQSIPFSGLSEQFFFFFLVFFFIWRLFCSLSERLVLEEAIVQGLGERKFNLKFYLRAVSNIYGDCIVWKMVGFPRSCISWRLPDGFSSQFLFNTATGTGCLKTYLSKKIVLRDNIHLLSILKYYYENYRMLQCYRLIRLSHKSIRCIRIE